MPRSIRWLTLSAAAAATATMMLVWPCGRAEADYYVQYGVSGTFGVDAGLPTGLAGGSFSGTYTASNIFPGPGDYEDFLTFNVNIFDRSGNLAYNLHYVSIYDPNDDGFFEPVADAPDRGLMGFYHQDPRTNALTELQLVFPLPFNGTGSAIPYDPTQQTTRSLFYVNRRIVEVASATSFVVPAPPSVVLVGLSGLAGLARAGLRRRSPTAVS